MGVPASKSSIPSRPISPVGSITSASLRISRRTLQAFLQSDSVSAALNKSESVLASLTVLKKICDHPGLLSANAAHSVISGSHKWAKKQLKGGKGASKKDRHGYALDDDFIVCSSEEDSGDESGVPEEDEEEEDRCRGTAAAGGGSFPAPSGSSAKEAAAGDEAWMKLAQASLFEDKLLEEIERKGADASCKSAFVLGLLDRLAADGHRTLIFSQSRVMLDILEVRGRLWLSSFHAFTRSIALLWRWWLTRPDPIRPDPSRPTGKRPSPRHGLLPHRWHRAERRGAPGGGPPVPGAQREHTGLHAHEPGEGDVVARRPVRWSRSLLRSSHRPGVS